MEKITRELKSDLINMTANLDCFTDERLGKFFRAVLTREIEKEKMKEFVKFKRRTK